MARLLAFLVLVLCATALAYVHRGDLWPKSGNIVADTNDPAAACMRQRFQDIDTMEDEGTITASQADLFKQRAEAMCRDIKGSGGSTPPALPDE